MLFLVALLVLAFTWPPQVRDEHLLTTGIILCVGIVLIVSSMDMNATSNMIRILVLVGFSAPAISSIARHLEKAAQQKGTESDF